MHDELIKRLRYAVTYDPRIVVQDCKDAADIIEELQAYADLYEYTSSLGLKLARSVLEAWPKWIPVSDRLPEPYQKVLCINKDAMAVGTYTKFGWIFPCRFDNVTHWLPLPRLPNEEEDET